MATPGVSTRPIVLISGKSPFCETFFDNVAAPKHKPRRQARSRLGRRQVSVDPRARNDRAAAAPACSTVRRSIRPPRRRTRKLGSTTRSCAPKSPRPPSTLTPPTRRSDAISTRSPSAASWARVRRNSNMTAPNSTSAGTSWRWRLPGADALYFDGNRGPERRRRLAAIEGQFDRRRHLGGDARHRRQAPARPARGLNPMLTLNEDQQLLMDSARAAVAAHAPVSDARRLARTGGRRFFARLLALCAEMGWTGVLVPEAHGGTAFGVVGAGLVAREMARKVAPSPFLSTAVLAATALAEGGSPEQQRAWLPRIAAAQAIVALAPDGAAATARRDGSAYHLDGESSISCSTATSPTRSSSQQASKRRRRCVLSQRMRAAFRARPASSSTGAASRASRSTMFNCPMPRSSRGRARARTHARRRPRRARGFAVRRR